MTGPRFDFTLEPSPRVAILDFADCGDGHSKHRRELLQGHLTSAFSNAEHVSFREPGHVVRLPPHASAVPEHVGLVLCRRSPIQVARVDAAVGALAAGMSRLLGRPCRLAVCSNTSPARNQGRAAVPGVDHRIAGAVPGVRPDQAVVAIIPDDDIAKVSQRFSAPRPTRQWVAMPLEPLVVATAVTQPDNRLAASINGTYPLNSHSRSSCDRGSVRARRDVSRIRRVRFLYTTRRASANAEACK